MTRTEGAETMPEAVLALDQGTTGSTALVFSHDGAVLGLAYGAISQSYRSRGGWNRTRARFGRPAAGSCRRLLPTRDSAAAI